MEYLTIDISYWHWIGLAIVALIIEVITGTGFLLWIGSSAAVVALLAFLLHVPVAAQFIIFALLAVSSALAWKAYLSRHPFVKDRTQLNRRAEQYIGRIFTLDEPVINGHGTIKVDDSMWRIICAEDLKAKEKVRVIETDGVFLIVEKEHPSHHNPL